MAIKIEIIIKIKILPIKKFNSDFLKSQGEKIEIQTEHFSRILNDDIIKEPNLLQTIKLNRPLPEQISYFGPNMIAYINKNGTIGILAGINDQNLFTEIEDKNCQNIAFIMI